MSPHLVYRLGAIQHGRNQLAHRRMNVHSLDQLRVGRAGRHELQKRVNDFIAVDAYDRFTDYLTGCRIHEYLHKFTRLAAPPRGIPCSSVNGGKLGHPRYAFVLSRAYENRKSVSGGPPPFCRQLR